MVKKKINFPHLIYEIIQKINFVLLVPTEARMVFGKAHINSNCNQAATLS